DRHGHGLALQRPAGLADLAAQIVDQALALFTGGPDEVFPLGSCPAPLLVSLAERLRGPQLGCPRSIERLARLVLRHPDPGQRFLEGALILREARAGVRNDRRIEAESGGDRERLAATRQADRQPVRRRQGLE